MTPPQIVTLAVLTLVIAALIWDKVRADIVAMAGAAVLLVSGAIRPADAQGAFGSPAVITLAALFIIVYAIELSGLLDRMIQIAVWLCRRIGAAGLWLLIVIAGAGSAFLNNTPIVVLTAPAVRDISEKIGLSPKRFLIPLSYMAVLGGTCTLVGTSTNLLVNDMAQVGGQPGFGIFEITPVGLIISAVGVVYLILFSRRLDRGDGNGADLTTDGRHARLAEGEPGVAKVFEPARPLRPWRALAAVAVFGGVLAAAALDVAPIAAAALAGAVILIIIRVIEPDEAYQGLRPEVLLLVVGMLVIGIALEKTGLAEVLTSAVSAMLQPFGPFVALALLYGVILLATELLSNATVAVLFTPIAVALADTLAVSPRPFLVAVMMAGSAAFATPFGYQTNVLVYQLGRYNYLDFVRIGLPLNLLTWVAAVPTIAYFFPF